MGAIYQKTEKRMDSHPLRPSTAVYQISSTRGKTSRKNKKDSIDVIEPRKLRDFILNNS